MSESPQEQPPASQPDAGSDSILLDSTPSEAGSKAQNEKHATQLVLDHLIQYGRLGPQEAEHIVKKIRAAGVDFLHRQSGVQF